MKKSIEGFLAVLCLLFLLLCPSLALEGAANGLLLWANVVLPTLLPFMICSGMIVALDGIRFLVFPFLPVLSGMFRFSPEGSYVFLSGVLCGYPMGAKTVREFTGQGRISQEEGKYLLAVCNHPSPMFISGYLLPRLTGLFHPFRQLPPQIVWISLYAPVPLLAFAAIRVYHYRKSASQMPAAPADTGCFSFEAHMMRCFETMVKIGGYIMLFSIFSIYLARSGSPFIRSVSPVLTGIIEITTGIQSISEHIPGVFGASLMIACAAFGGICGIYQTRSVLFLPDMQKSAGLSVRHYILWKLLHSLLSGILFYVLTGLWLQEW